jgi:hypothetical protein
MLATIIRPTSHPLPITSPWMAATTRPLTMTICEMFVLDDVIDPMATGNINLQ